MRTRKAKKPKQPKRISYTLISKSFDWGKAMYVLLDSIIDAHHQDLRKARIALAWCTSWKADVDGRQQIGKCKKASDLDRELAAFDFIILISKSFWQGANDAQKTALIDHELCHAAVRHAKDGEPEEDERGRPIFRMRKHDLEEFACIVERHGLYKRDLETFAQAMRRSAQGDLFATDTPKTPTLASAAATH